LYTSLFPRRKSRIKTDEPIRVPDLLIILVCFLIAIPSWLIGKAFPVIGGPVIAILAGMVITCFWTEKGTAESGIKWTSKIILQTAVVLLGFGMNLGVILQTGKGFLSPCPFRKAGNIMTRTILLL